MKQIAFIFCMLTAFFMDAQYIQPSLISPTGMYQKDNNGNTHMISIGEPAITTLSGNSNVITQGFLQPLEILVGTEYLVDTAIDINVFPNPTSDIIRIDFSSLSSSTLQLNIFDKLGRRLYSNRIDVLNGKSSIEVNVHNWSAGTYFIKAVDQNQVLTAAFKFIKI